jgi:hypothetical protein
MDADDVRPSVYAAIPEPIDLTLSDEDVVARVRGGDTALFEIIMRRYNQRLFRTARAITRDDEEATDVVQDASRPSTTPSPRASATGSTAGPTATSTSARSSRSPRTSSPSPTSSASTPPSTSRR